MALETHRTVYLPLEKLDKCSVCSKTEKLSLCSSCGERIYCSSACQKEDWSTHKAKCGKTDRIDLGAFWPYFAFMGDQLSAHKDKPVHFALQHKVVNDPNPTAHPWQLPDGSAAKVLVLGDPYDVSAVADDSSWWPLAKTAAVRSKLVRRILREGYSLQIAMAICVSILAELYTTTSAQGSKERRLRFRYHSSPIADFGIATGSADVKHQDKLAYAKLSDGSVTHGQNPDDHYWIYFTTVRGEEVVLDLSMFTFNMTLSVTTAPYSTNPEIARMFPYAPGFFRDREFRRNSPELHKERKRVSVLRNEALHDAVRISEQGFSVRDKKTFVTVMEELSGRKMTDKETELTMEFALCCTQMLDLVLESGKWKTFPEEPETIIEQDPGEVAELETLKWEQSWKKWKKDKKKALKP